MVNQAMSDKEMINDSISSQKLIESSYCTYANECVNNTLRSDFLNILKEENDIQADLFVEMQSRGWYNVKPADKASIDEAKQKFKK